MIAKIFEVLGALGVFLFGMRVLSEGLQKVAGGRLQKTLNFITANRFVAVLTGFIITAFIQSSSATTVMVVSFCNASLLSLTQAIGIIMGANIGTTVTTWIVSFVGFKFSISAISLPIIGIGFPLLFSKNHHHRNVGESFIGFGILFLGLGFLKDAVPDIRNHPEILEFLKNYTDLGLISYLIFVAVGTALTMIIQSSSAMMAITVTIAFKGWVDLPSAAAMVLGENIGTTITAYLASLGTITTARRAARAHLFFNVIGVFWMTFVFRYFLKLVLWIAPWDSSIPSNFPLDLALFHTVFNTVNTLLFIGLVEPYARFIEKLVKPAARDIATDYQFKYISSIGLQDAASMNIVKAQNEMVKMGRITKEMLMTILDLLLIPGRKIGRTLSEAKQKEELVDKMHQQISQFLVHLYNEELNSDDINRVNALIRIVQEIEHIADNCYNILLLIERKTDKKIQFHVKAADEIKTYSELILTFMDLCQRQLETCQIVQSIDEAVKLENQIDQRRDELVKGVRRRLQKDKNANVQAELLYLDLVKYFEHIGDNSLNIMQALKIVC